MKENMQFLRAVQHRAARSAIGASAARGQGGPGIVASAREFLSGMNLSRFGTNDKRAFARALDAETKGLMSSIPRRSASWGLARKLLNIFLRDSLYTGYLSTAHALGKAESHFEIPLDSITAKRVRRAVPGLSPWPGVKHLDRPTSEEYQAAAAQVAQRMGISRVHLDAYWWGMRE